MNYSQTLITCSLRFVMTLGIFPPSTVFQGADPWHGRNWDLTFLKSKWSHVQNIHLILHVESRVCTFSFHNVQVLSSTSGLLTQNFVFHNQEKVYPLIFSTCFPWCVIRTTGYASSYSLFITDGWLSDGVHLSCTGRHQKKTKTRYLSILSNCCNYYRFVTYAIKRASVFLHLWIDVRQTLSKNEAEEAFNLWPNNVCQGMIYSLRNLKCHGKFLSHSQGMNH